MSTPTNNNTPAKSPKPSHVPQYQQYFHLLQSMSTNPIPNSNPLNPSTSTTSLLSPSISTLGSSPTNFSSSWVRRTTLSAILGTDNALDKKLNLPTLSANQANKNSGATTAAASSQAKNSSDASSASGFASSVGSSSTSNNNTPPLTLVGNASGGSNNLSATSTTTTPKLIINTTPNNVANNSGNLQASPIPIMNPCGSAEQEVPSPAVKSQKKRAPKKVESPPMASSTTPNPSETNDENAEDNDESKKGRSKTCKRWTEEQNRLLRDAVLRYGPRNWKKIAAEISGGIFTADQCNQHWHRVLHVSVRMLLF